MRLLTVLGLIFALAFPVNAADLVELRLANGRTTTGADTGANPTPWARSKYTVEITGVATVKIECRDHGITIELN